MTKTVYKYDPATSIYAGEMVLDESYLTPVTHEWAIPAYTTDIKPPAAQEGYNIVWTGAAWELVEIPVPPAPPEPTPEEKIAKLDAQYQSEKNSLCIQYTDAEIHGDTETAAAIVEEMTALDEWYDEEYRKIIEEG